MHKKLMVIAIVLLSALAACSDDQVPTATATPPGVAEEEHMEEAEHADDQESEAVEQGLALYRSAGCAACHGQNGEGDTGPALAGHTPEQVERQVRAPTGDVMPAFGREQLSDEQLGLIVSWIQSLGPATGEHHHEEEGHMGAFETDAPLAAHLRLALFAVKEGNAHDAEHHMEDLIALLEDEHFKEQAEEILSSLQGGADMHDLEHDMEHMMGELAPESGATDVPSFHLQLALDGLTLDNVEAAGHHLEHYAGLVGDAQLAAEARELQAHLDEGELDAVREGIRALMAGQEPGHED